MKIKQISIVLIFAMCVSSVALFMQSCSSEDTTNDDSTYVNMNINLEKIGREHNKGLDYIFKELEKGQNLKSAKTINTNINLNNIIENASVSFVLESDYGNTVKKEKLHEVVSLSKTNSLTKSNDALHNNVNLEDFDYLLTTKQQYYLNKFKEILASLKIDGKIESIKEELKILDKEIISDCTSEEAIPLLTATSVGRYSLDYWNENLYKWATLFENEIGTTALAPRLKSGTIEVQTNKEEWEWFTNALVSMGQSDGIGAALGAGLGSLAGGVGAVPGAVSGGCVASAGAGVKELLTRWGIF